MRAPTAFSILATIALAAGGYLYWSSQRATSVPTGLAVANGRIEVERVDIAAKLPGRVAEIRVKEGDFVEKDAIIAQLDTAELRAQLAAAKASVHRAIATIGRAEAEITIREAEHNLRFSNISKSPSQFCGAGGSPSFSGTGTPEAPTSTHAIVP